MTRYARCSTPMAGRLQAVEDEEEEMANENIETPSGQPPAAGSKSEITAQAGAIASRGLEQAEELTATTRARLLRTADQKKSALRDKLDGLAETMDDVASRRSGEDELSARVTTKASDIVRRVSRTLSESSTEELIQSLGRKVREEPIWFLAGCLTAGFIGARLLRK